MNWNVCLINYGIVNTNINLSKGYLSKYCSPFISQNPTEEQKVKADEIRERRNKVPDLTEDLRKQHNDHSDKYEKTREPMLIGLASEYDLDLFRTAQAKACEQIVSYFVVGARFTQVYPNSLKFSFKLTKSILIMLKYIFIRTNVDVCNVFAIS